MYNDESRVLHLGNVANTGQNLVRYAQTQGRSWALRDIPAAPSLKSPSAWARRASDALSYSLGHAKPDLAHIHYGPNGYYGALKAAPFVLHLHGTDLRRDLHKPLLGELECYSLARAERVVVSTPDLLEDARQLRPDSLYIPNPLPIAALPNGKPSLAPVPKRVVFSARWDDAKGGLGLVRAAEELVNQGFDVVGVDWGTYAGHARDAGVSLLPLMTPADFRSLMASGEVIVGQMELGILSIAELEAMATGRPVVTSVDVNLEGNVPVKNTDASGLAQSVLELVSDPAEQTRLGEAGKEWVANKRSPHTTFQMLETLYSEILG